MFNPNGFDNAPAGGVAVLEIVEERKTEAWLRFVPLKRTEVGGEILGPLAAMTVTHVYGYSREQCEKTLEALYRFPLPGDAAITGVTVSFGEVEIRAELRERSKAEADYEEARREGRQATLVTRESPDVFTLRVAGLRPDEEVTITTTYVQLATAEGAGWSLRVPLATAPRYVRTDELTSRHADGQPLALLRDPGHRFSLDLLIPGAGAVESATHALDLEDEDGRTRVRLRDRLVVPDRDCVITWRMEQQEDRPALRVFTHEDGTSGYTYFLALVAPPASPDPDRAVPRETVLLVDHSGSMEGPKWTTADWAVNNFLSGLTERDRFALGVFHNTTRWLGRDLRRGDAAGVEAARRFLSEARDSGGTELGVALEQALRIKRGEGERSRHMLILTDAEVSDAGRILRLAEGESRRKDRRRISVLCIDAAPNSFLARQIAQRGGGAARFLSSDPSHGDITTALESVLLDWAQPVLAGLRLKVAQPGLQAADREVTPALPMVPLRTEGEPSSPDQRRSVPLVYGGSAADLGDLPAGRAVWVVGRMPVAEETLEFWLEDSGDRIVAADRGEPAGGGALKALFGAWRVLGLEFLAGSGRTGEELIAELARLGYDPKEALAGPPDREPLVYADSVREENQRALSALLLRESLGYGLLTSATGFVAVRLEAGKPVEETVVVAGALPAGWSEEFVGAPAMDQAAPKLAMRRPAGGMAAPMPPPAADASVIHFALAESPPEAGPSLGIPSFLRRRSSGGGRGERGPEAGLGRSVVFSGEPDLRSGEAVLFDDVVAGGRYSRLRVRLPDGAPVPDPGILLLLFAGDMAAPVVRARLVDLLRQGGERPVNLSLPDGTRVVIVLRDPAGAWAAGAPRIEVELS